MEEKFNDLVQNFAAQLNHTIQDTSPLSYRNNNGPGNETKQIANTSSDNTMFQHRKNICTYIFYLKLN